jgi:hypothetical protein
LRRDIHDVDTDCHYTVKIYESENTQSDTGEWQHTRITLKPNTTEEGYEPILLDGSEVGGLKVIAELMAVLE